jgi:hypothetical protein
MTRLDPAVKHLIHRHHRLNLSELAKFGEAPHATQVTVLAELRRPVGDQSSSVEITLGASALAFITIFFVPTALVPDGAPWLARIVIGAIVGLGAAAVLIPIFIGPYLRTSAQTVACVWLAAYEEELARRWASKGKKARRWQRKRDPFS